MSDEDPGTQKRAVSAPHDERHQGQESTAPYGLSRLAPSISLVDVAKEIQDADRTVGVATTAKLKTIADQIQRLQQEAQRIMETAREDLLLHRASCAFPRRPGQVYHLYERESGLYWSMVSPDEWGDHAPHAFRGSYRLGLDQSWTRTAGEVDQVAVDPVAFAQQVILPE